MAVAAAVAAAVAHPPPPILIQILGTVSLIFTIKKNLHIIVSGFLTRKTRVTFT